MESFYREDDLNRRAIDALGRDKDDPGALLLQGRLLLERGLYGRRCSACSDMPTRRFQKHIQMQQLRSIAINRNAKTREVLGNLHKSRILLVEAIAFGAAKRFWKVSAICK